MDPFKYEDAANKGYINTNGDWPTVRINFPVSVLQKCYFSVRKLI